MTNFLKNILSNTKVGFADQTLVYVKHTLCLFVPTARCSQHSGV